MALAFVATAAVAGSPAAGQFRPQAPTGSRVVKAPKKLDRTQLGEMKSTFSRCLYGMQSKLVNRLLRNSDYISVDWSSVGFQGDEVEHRFDMQRCVNNLPNDDGTSSGMALDAGSLRLMLLEAAYLAKPKPLFEATLAAPVTPRSYVSVGDALVLAKAWGELSDCMVGQNVAGADAILRTHEGSAEEGRAISAVLPAVAGCISAGNQIKLNADVVRGLAADGLWQRYTAISVPNPPVGKAN